MIQIKSWQKTGLGSTEIETMSDSSWVICKKNKYSKYNTVSYWLYSGSKNLKLTLEGGMNRKEIRPKGAPHKNI